MRFESRPNEPFREVLRDNARDLRKHQSLVERLLWSRLKGNTLGIRFRRQHRIGVFIVDFHSAAKRVVIELDGRSHEYDQQLDKDGSRDQYFATRGMRIVRFTNQQV